MTIAIEILSEKAKTLNNLLFLYPNSEEAELWEQQHKEILEALLVLRTCKYS